jgi:predicted NBD/HSP70 family sugar kinase
MYRTAAQPATLRRLNRRAVIRFLQGTPNVTRADCARALGVSQPTVGKIVDELVVRGVVEEVEADGDGAEGNGNGNGVARRLGRPGQMLRLDRTRPRLVLIHLGVVETRVAAVPVGLRSEDVWAESFATPRSPEAWRDELAQVAERLPRRGLWGTVVSTPGVVDQPAGRVLLSPNLHWTESASLPDLCQSVWPAVPALLVQESRALALGHLRGEVETADDFVAVDFGSGVGSAAVIGGRLYAGALAMSGELGHTPVPGNDRRCGCGATGCVETLVSRTGLLRSFAESQGKQSCTWPELIAHVAERGAEDWLRRALDAAASSVAGAMNVLGLRHAVVTGSLTDLPPAVDYLSAAVVRGAMWGRFGEVTCRPAPRRRALGLVAAAVEHFLLAREHQEQ